MTALLNGASTLDHGVTVAALVGGVVYYIAIKLSQLLSRRLTPISYSKLSAKDKLDWDDRLPSNLHALVLTGAAAYLFFLTDLFSEGGSHTGKVIYRTNALSDGALGFSVGYFLADITYMFQNPCLWEPAMAAHHVAALASVAAAAFRRHAHNYTLALLATEVTTPFVNARWMMDKAGHKQSTLYMVNGVSLLVAWFLGRIVLFAFFFHHAAGHMEEIQELPWTSFVLVVFVPLLLFGLNVWWFSKILRGALKLLLTSTADKAHADELLSEGADLLDHPSHALPHEQPAPPKDR